MPQFQYKNQQFQQDAVNAVVDVFRGVDFTPLLPNSVFRLTGAPPPSIPSTGEQINPVNFFLSNFRTALENNLRDIQQRNNIQPACSLGGEPYLVLDTHMETGTGKTFTFINAIFELHKKYKLTHFVVIVPSIAIKEGIKKSFSTTATYFERLYQQRLAVLELTPAKKRKGRKSPPSGVMNFVYSQHLTVLIMTNHSFNRPDNIINQKLEGFYVDNAPTPMDAIAAKNPVLIIDEPQRVEGTKTAGRIENFNPAFVLRYSATFREGQIKNLIYVLDSYDAFNKKLVKGITVTDYKTDSTDSAFLGVQRILTKGGKITAELVAANKAGSPLTVTVGVEKESATGRLFTTTENPVYNHIHVTTIDNREKTVTFSNGETLKPGEFLGRETQNDNIVAEVMLRDTINKHLRKEQELFRRGIKCISLIFIDRVKDYRDYNTGDEIGYLQKSFEKCYQECMENFLKLEKPPREYRDYLSQWVPEQVHGGYFSGDTRRNRALDEGDATGENDKARQLQQEISELILRDKERILGLNNQLRFIFAHSALREGWDNPNIFQICKLRSSYSETNVVQEIGRGLRICVNQTLERQDTETVGNEFLACNRLDVFTLGNGEFIKQLQVELSHRRNEKKKDFVAITIDKLANIYNLKQIHAAGLFTELHKAGCIDEDGYLISKSGIEEVLVNASLDPQKLLLKLPQAPDISDGRSDSNEPRTYSVSKTHYQKFKALWKLLHQKVVYQVKYSEDFESKVIDKINSMGMVGSPYVHRITETLDTDEGEFFKVSQQDTVDSTPLFSNLSAPAFLNQLAEKIHLPRNTIIRILSKIESDKYMTIRKNPFAAIQHLSDIITGVIYQNIMDNIRYIKLGGLRKAEITLTDKEFTAQHYLELENLPEYKDNNLWREIAPYDSEDLEKKISEGALGDSAITVFAKLPRAVNIPAPMHPKGINPDFAFVVQRQNGDSQFYFVAEAKPTTETDSIRPIEKNRIEFMKKYFDGIEADVKFKVVSNYQQLLDLFGEAGAPQ